MAAAAADREFDAVILGASGFTGKYVIREALRHLSSANPSSPLRTIALAGRNLSKINRALAWASQPSSPPPLSLIFADVSSPSSLLSLARRTKLVLNCVRPFGLYGDPVVAACVSAGTDYLDVSGEPGFMEQTEANHHENAVKNGSLVVSACGFDSVLAELGVMFNSRQWTAPAAPNRIEGYLTLESDKRLVLNAGTYKSVVFGLANAASLQELRKSRPRKAEPAIIGPPPPKGPLLEHQKSLGLWALKLPVAEAIVVGRTLAALTQNPDGLPGADESTEHTEKRKSFWSGVKPAHFSVRMGSKSLLSLILLILTGLFTGIFEWFSFGRSLPLMLPEIFPLGWFRKTGPTEADVKSTVFKMWFVGHGYSDASVATQGGRKVDTEIITRVSGPEVGYIATPIILIQCALVVLGQRRDLPKGGVFPPGIIFGATDLQERLQKNGITFDVISKRALP